MLASAWRYLILSGSMTLAGFGNLLRTHGAGNATVEALHDWLPEDGSINDLHDRGKLARQWLNVAEHVPGQLIPVAGLELVTTPLPITLTAMAYGPEDVKVATMVS